jgi:hypothetical protein
MRSDAYTHDYRDDYRRLSGNAPHHRQSKAIENTELMENRKNHRCRYNSRRLFSWVLLSDLGSWKI